MTQRLTARLFRPNRLLLPGVFLLLLAPGLSRAADREGAFPAELERGTPDNVGELRAIQKQVRRALAKAVPCTVGLRLGPVSGSGVIVSADGYVLTAGHVVSRPDRDVVVVLSDGRKVKGKSLGVNRDMDSGLVKITEKGKWPFAEMGDASALKKGQWCLAVGHPGGYRDGRSPVVRLGRVLDKRQGAVRTDCALVGGDSGGPLFDLHGKVIAIHSRIGPALTLNLHVPVDTYRDTWDRLAKGEAWGGPSSRQPYLGFRHDPDAKDCRVLRVLPETPAEKAGLEEDDVITRFAGHKIDTFEDLLAQLRKKKPGDRVTVEVRRGKKTIPLKVTLGKREA